MSSKTLRELVVSGALWVGIERWVNQILSLTIYVVLARLLDPTSFGLIALAGVYIAFIEIFANQGFLTAIVQRKDLQDAHLDSAFWLNVFMTTCFALGSIVAAKQLAVLFGEPKLTDILMWLSGVLFLKGLSIVPQALLEREMAFRALTIRSLLATIAGGVVGLGMAWEGFGALSLVGQQLSNAVVGTAVLCWATSWRPSFRISARHLRDLYGFSISMVGNDLLWFGAQRADQTLIGVAFGASALGPYALAMRSISIFKDLLIGPLQVVALPAFSRLQDERERLKNAFYDLTEVVGMTVVPLFCGLAALAPTIVPMVFGTQWSSAILLFQILTVYGLVTVPLSFGHQLMMATGRPGVCLMLYVLQTCVTLGLCILATRWGPVAIACAMALAMLVHAIVFLLVCRTLVGISIRVLMSRMWASILVSVVMLAAVLAFQASLGEKLDALLTVIGGSFLGASIYCVGVACIKPDWIRQVMQNLLLRGTRHAA